MPKRYANYSLPEELAKRVKELIEDRKDLGYSSVNEFVKDAVRRLLEHYENNPPPK